MRGVVSRRVPQVVQTSAMDCGPAVLTSVLRGHGLGADLDGVRDLCATGVDGTSIDVLTDLAVAFGLRARQVVVPVDHLGGPGDGLLPAVVVTELPGALLHFVVVWRRVGRWVEVMDPASGRRWVSLASLRGDLYRHEMHVRTEAWREYAGSDAFVAPLKANLGACGVSDVEVDELVAGALASPQAGPIARLDAVARRAVRFGHSQAQVRRALADAEWSALEPDSMVAADPASGPGAHVDNAELVMRGAVVLSVDGADPGAEIPVELAQRVLVDSPSAWSVLGAMLAGSGVRRLVASVAALFAGSVGSIAVVFGLEQLVSQGTGAGSRGVLGVICAVLALAAGLSVAGMSGAVAAGRRVELELRERLDQRVGRLPDKFFRTRPSSDLAERAHSIHRLRDLSTSVAELSVAAGQVAAAVVCLLVAAPAAWWAVLLLVPAVVLPSLLSTPVLVEREHRSRTIAGALSHVYLDSLLGALPIRAHRAAAAIESEHTELLESWAAAERSRHRLGAAAIIATLVAGYGAAALVVAAASTTAELSGVVLVAFLGFVAVNAGVVLVNTLRRLAPQWIVAQRLLALSTVELDPPPASTRPVAAIEIELRSVTVDGDHGPLLDDVSLHITAGEHLGIVGPSGAGKSTLVAVLLGWVTPDRGQVLVDGVELTPDRAAALRALCGWVDPDVSVWAGTLADNLRADPRTAPPGWSRWAPRIGLDVVVKRLGGPGGQVGESGRLLSGGEAQRVRLGRLFMRADAPLVVLDEATRGLDSTLRASTLAAINHQFAAATTISVTHDLDEAATMARVVYLDRGRVLADGPPAELLADPDNEFTTMVRADRDLRSSLDTTNGWTVAHLEHGRLHIDRPATPPTPAPSTQAPPPPQDLARAGIDATPGPARTTSSAGLRAAVPLTVAATVVIAAEWTLFLRGWSAMLATTRSSWWPLWFTAAAAAAGLSAWLLGAAAVHVGTRLRRRLLDGGMRIDLDGLRRSGSGDLNGRVLEAEMFEQQAVTGGTDTLFGVAQLVGALVVVAIADGPTTTAAAILTWLATLVAVAFVATRVRHDWTSERINRTRLLLERFRGHRTETVYGPPPNAGGEHLDEYRDRSRRSDRAKTMLLANANVWLFAGVAVTATTATDQSLLGGLGAVLLAWTAFGVLGVAFDDLVTAATALRQLRVLLPTDAHVPGGPALASDQRFPGIAHVSYRYSDASPPLLDDITMAPRPGDRVLLHGDSGSGKSTLGSVLAGVRQPTTGTVHGGDRVVYVAQFGDNHTFQASLAFNVLMGRAWPPATADLDDAADLLGDLGLADLAERMPRGLAQPVGDAGWQLSHGERGRIYLARALAQQPDVIVLDESLEGLDPRTVTAALAATKRRVPAIVVISHR